MAGDLVGLDGAPLASKGSPKPQAVGLDMSNPVDSLDLLGSIARSGYVTAQQMASAAGIKGERHIKLQCRDISGLASQMALTAEFASNSLAALRLTLAAAAARVRTLQGFIPEDLKETMAQADMDIAVEWENRRRNFSTRVPIQIKKKERIGIALAEAIAGPAPTKEDFDALLVESVKLGLITQEAVDKAQADLDAEARYKAALADGKTEEEARLIGWPAAAEAPQAQADAAPEAHQAQADAAPEAPQAQADAAPEAHQAQADAAPEAHQAQADAAPEAHQAQAGQDIADEAAPEGAPAAQA